MTEFFLHAIQVETNEKWVNGKLIRCMINLVKNERGYLVEMYPSVDSARFDSVLTRVFQEKARLG